MKLKSFLTFFFLIFITSISFSQRVYKPAFYIIGSDTTYGTGIMGSAQMSFTFKVNNSKEVEKFGPSQADAFKYIDGRYFVSEEIIDLNGRYKKYFLEYLVDGEVDLFILNSRYFIKKDGEEFLELKHTKKREVQRDGKTYMAPDFQYVIDMKKYMSETPQLFPKIDKLVNLDQSALVKISTDYHDLTCAGSECINYTKTKPKHRFDYRLEAISGFNRHNDYYSMQIGAILYISNKNMKNVYLRVGLLLADARAQYRTDKDSHYYPRIPISMMFTFGKGKIKPLLGIGFTTGIFPLISIEGGLLFPLEKNIDVKLSGAIDGVPSYISGSHPEIFDNKLAHTISLGIVFNLNRKK